MLLSDYDRDAFEDMLRALTAERTNIAEVMDLPSLPLAAPLIHDSLCKAALQFLASSQASISCCPGPLFPVAG